nr:L-serine ammonia-lyase, iron-sulfur-dependent, subunit alpha [uncultured Oscillibacter sp.]
MDKRIYDNYVAILKSELIASFGCTEPIVIAYASAKAREVLDEEPVKLELLCSGNVIKNVKSVIVPNSGGERGIPIAAALGAIGGDAGRRLEVLSAITPEQIRQAKAFVDAGACSYDLIPDVPNLYVAVTIHGTRHTAKVVLEKEHTQITEIRRDGALFFDAKAAQTQAAAGEKELLNVRDILTFAREADISDVEPLLRRQIAMNSAISQEGLSHPYGAQVGRSILEIYGADDVRARARAAAAAGSDARMSGCELPVVINSGSGNQGLTVSLPVLEYARMLDAPQETLYRALALSNLISIHIKRHIGVLSAFCGAVSAGAGSGAAITFLHGGSYEQICMTIVNTLANVGGIVCDGAKSSCAAKIASSVEAAIVGHHMAMAGRVFRAGEGLVKDGVEATIQSIGRMAREGMRATDTEILRIMIT